MNMHNRTHNGGPQRKMASKQIKNLPPGDLREWPCETCGCTGVRAGQGTELSNKGPIFSMVFFCAKCRTNFVIKRPLQQGDNDVYDRWLELNPDVDLSKAPKILVARDMPPNGRFRGPG